jgi:hypothetical protein
MMVPIRRYYQDGISLAKAYKENDIETQVDEY